MVPDGRGRGDLHRARPDPVPLGDRHHFQGFRYLDLTLASYVGEDVVIRYDPRDMAEIRIYHRDAFLCRAVCQELAGQTIGLKDVIRARSQRRKQLRSWLNDQAAAVELLLGVHQQPEPVGSARPGSSSTRPRSKLRSASWRCVPPKHGQAGEPAPVHPHLLRHARVRQIVRQTKSLPLAQK